jgi:hypothetical protein
MTRVLRYFSKPEFASVTLRVWTFKALQMAPYRSGPSRTWIKVKNPNAPAATRAVDGTF